MQLKLIRRAGLVFFMVAVAFFTYWLLRPNPLLGAAKRMVTAMRDGDGDALYDATIIDERQCSDLTPQKLRQVWEILVKPLVTSSHFEGDDPIKLESNQTQAVGVFRYLSKLGDPWTLNAIANQSDEGAKTDVVYSMLATASLFDDDGHASPTLTSDLALKGLRRYRSRLEAVGIHRLMLAPGTCVSWDELEAKLRPKS